MYNIIHLHIYLYILLGIFLSFVKLLEFTVFWFKIQYNLYFRNNTPENQIKRFTANYYLHSTLELVLTTSTFCTTLVFASNLNSITLIETIHKLTLQY